MMTENNETEEDNEPTIQQLNNNQTRIDADLSGISLTVETEGKEECEELFNDTWDKMLDDAEKMSESLTNRLNSL